MSGPRVTSGEDSKQDYATPADFISVVEQRFGKISLDLAAHRQNKKHARYLAPKELTLHFDAEKWTVAAMVETLVSRGADRAESLAAATRAAENAVKAKVTVLNRDPDAFGLDSFAYDWADLQRQFPGVHWLNCEFADVAPWAKKGNLDGLRGGNTTLLTPAQVGANWYRDFIAGAADGYYLNGRLCFDGKNPFPKDCMLSHFHPGATGAVHLWDWKRDRILRTWGLRA